MTKEEMKKFIIKEAMQSPDAINFMYDLEQIVLELTEDWDWAKEKDERSTN